MGILPQIIANSIIAGAIYALIALGFNLIYRTTKFFNLAHGALTVVGGYAMFFLYKQLEWNIYASALVSVLFTGGAGYMLDKLVFRRLRNRGASQMVFLIAALGLLTVIQAIIAILFTSQFQTLADSAMQQQIYDIFGGIITQTQAIIAILGVMILVGITWMLKYTMFGRAINAVSDDEEVAKMVGIHTNKIIGWVFFIGSAIAGLSGILVGFDTGLEPTMGMSLLMKGVIAAIIGGIGTMHGAFAGAFLLGFAENFGVWQFSGEWKDAIAFIILIIFLLFRPKGIFKR
ncbi:TPA: branched-chain amino acid ABC transporter permease [Candidatus Wolfebacteria bacterium]|uniref:Inner-membrane translocator n=2 Tax=Candidatus Wolfeibacteriota TaxID=1752735 RepID=A0A0G1X7N2_9BACT|nr:MAG: inner-membrane translocator, branched-chain amino acid transport system permease protein [Candidatus Wolfebacteria bacterium GW2011_GWB1_47_1]KKU59738.1 MAG: Inner-membrane translocator [Candidatus Wolfebacteria bacterium GW2011_GWE2_47_12]KKU65729.1 MAG: Inner-membrane translocator [Candidatus Wolfebacteria bacterium GW2011_GWD2_47_17]KKU76733.1 MAG: Inner-membrane translocator [Candidatus Wolfebacteria bacterium GW2011_GWA1_47_6]KKU90380.1 MAG: Inner-membrane translocator [Candidatus 